VTLDEARQNFPVRQFRQRPHVDVISVNLMGRKPEFFSEAAGEAARRCVFSNPHPEGTARIYFLQGTGNTRCESIEFSFHALKWYPLSKQDCAERTEE
jgi:hypothetical protein